MSSNQRHQTAGTLNAQGQKIGGQFGYASHAVNEHVSLGSPRDTPNFNAVRAQPAARTVHPARKVPAVRKVNGAVRAVKYAAAGALAAGGFAATTAGTVMAASASPVMGLSVLAAGGLAVAFSVRTADSAMTAPSVVR